MPLMHESDSEDELPPGWEERVTLDGWVYYANHATKGTQWTHPRTGKKKKVTGDLPPNWERHVSENGRVIYVDIENQRRTYTDPRLAFATEERTNSMDFRQRFDASSKALQVLHGHDLSGKVFLITGATNGIGFETAKSLAQHGAEIILCGRSETSCKQAEERILKEKPNAKTFPLIIDLSSLTSVKYAANVVKNRYKCLDVMILNAGVFAIGWQQTEDGLESVFQINHLGHFYFTLLLEDMFRPRSRIVIVSSESHRFSNVNRYNISEELLSPSSPVGYWDMMAYNNSKLCNVLFGLELHKRWSVKGIGVYSLHPGNLVSTGLPKRSCWFRFVFAIVRPFTKSLQQAASTSVFAAVAPELEYSSGVYLNNCCLCSTSRPAQDELLATKLWQISEDIITRLCGPIIHPSAEI